MATLATSSLPATVAADVVGGDIAGVSNIGSATPGASTVDAGVESMEASQLNKDDKDKIKEEDTKSRFSIPVIIAAALVFIVVIAWFESIKVWLNYAFNSSTKVLFTKALGDTIYAIAATIISVFLLWLLIKFFIKK